MNGRLSDEAAEVGVVVRDSFAARGGVDLLRRAAEAPDLRAEIAEILDGIGVWELDPLSDPLEAEVAAAVCRAAGHDVLPYPVAERLAGCGHGAVAPVSQDPPHLGMHLDLDLGWRGVDLHGRRYRLADAGELLRTPLAPFGVRARFEPDGGEDPRGAALLVVLQSWWILGLLEHALADTTEYTGQREQFGRALIRFQAVGSRLAEMTVAVQSLHELAKYALWVLAQDAAGVEALVEAVGLRVAALRAADEVLRGAHQLYGAMGFTDEVDLSWLSRAGQAVRRLPESGHATHRVLAGMIQAHGWREFGRPGAAVTTAARAAV